MTSEAQGRDGIYREDATPSSDPTDAAYPPRNSSAGHSGEGADGLGVWRGIAAALVIEAGAVGAVWLVWYCAGLVAAWWREMK